MMLAKAPVSLAAVRARKADRRTAVGDARMEVLAFIDEVLLAMHTIVDAEISRDIPSARVINEAGRIVTKAAKARAEYMALTGPEGAA